MFRLRRNPVSFASTARVRREGGYMLLILMFFVMLLTFSMLATLPRVVQQVKRDREEEMIHRGTEYARAVKKYFKKFNRYPNSLQDLENTNNLRFLRRRFKDPMTKEGNWRLLHITDVQQGISNPNFGVSQGGNFNPQQGTGPGGTTQINIGGGGGMGLQTGGFGQPSNPVSPQNQQSATGQSATGQTDASKNAPSGENEGEPGNPATGAPGSPSLGGQTGQTYGGGGIVGVASMSKAKSIRVFNNKSNYNKWMFIYDQTQDRGNTLLKGPYNPQAFVGGSNAQGTGGNGLSPNGTPQPLQPQQPQQQGGPGQQMSPDQNAPPQ